MADIGRIANLRTSKTAKEVYDNNRLLVLECKDMKDMAVVCDSNRRRILVACNMKCMGLACGNSDRDSSQERWRVECIEAPV